MQHFSRELARYFRNLVVIKISGAGTRLVAASPNEQANLAATAARFSEEDLTRYLQLALDLFGDLQASLQPRLHLEIGLLRMVHAGKLQSIEDALASLGGASTPKPPAPKPPATPAPSADVRSRLHAALIEAKHMHIADAIEHSEISETAGELVVTTPKMYVMFLKQKEFESAARRVSGASKITIKTGDPETPAVETAAPAPDETSSRALSHPEVRRFQETFPDSQVRAVRNLREN